MEIYPPRLERGILTPSLENTINIRHNLALPSKKRKVDDCLEQLSPWAPFTIKPHPSTIFDRPQILTPILLLPRSHLPLSCLDNVTTSAALPCTRLFTTRVSCLDPVELESKNLSILSVLIARLEFDGSLVAIERVGGGIYALCRLGNWVKLDQLRAAASVVRNEAPPHYRDGLSVEEGLEWWEAAKVDSPRLPNRKRIKIVHDTTGCPAGTKQADANLNREEGPSSPRAPAQLETNTLSQPAQEMLTINEIPVATTEPTTQDIFEMIQIQYLESLYVSKTSLAYFAKGPLSRARASFQNEESSASSIKDLVTFLQSLVLYLNVMDKKYREPLPNIIQSIPPGDVSDDQMDDKTGQKLKKKKKKKRKKLSPGKDGLYTEEDRYISKWWRASYDDSTAFSVEETRDQLIKRRLASLRTRETKLQIILILEVLALEMSVSKGQGTTDSQKDEMKDSKKGKEKKMQDLNLILELLVDRLCIWQSLNNEDLSRGESGKTSKSTQVSSHDDLRDFCVEVIVPFYAARLPEKCAAVNQKLGGPSVPSPIRMSNPSKSARISKSSKRPSLISKHSLPELSHRKIERVSTGERLAQVRGDSRQSSRPPALTRSATLPAVPALKRERTETPIPLSEIPAKNSRQMSISRSGVLNSKELRQREVDLSVVANKKSVDAKSKKNSQIENELKGAITALKKPNRGLAIKDYVESCERRTFNGGINANRRRKWTDCITARSVQVEATPRGKHKMAMTGAVFPVSQREALISDDCIPSSSLPPPVQYTHSQQDMISPVARRTLPAVQDTPCRGVSKFATRIPSSTRWTQEQGSFVSPSNPRRNSMQLVSQAVSYCPTTLSAAMTASNIVSETPSGRLSKRSQKLVVETESTEQGKLEEHQIMDLMPRRMIVTTSATTRTVDDENGKSIYESLGWDDEVDELA